MNKLRKIIYLTIFVVISCIIGCSPQKRYDVLSYVFDGVPNPALEDSLARIDSLKLLANNTPEILAFNSNSSSTIFHPPYQERQCDMCHKPGSFGELTQDQPDLCYNCHENFSEKYSFVHGPVEGGFCSACHNPHKSEQEKLLINTGQDICFKCHEKDMILSNEVHEGIEDTFCTECHNPHGGEDRFIFR